MDNAATNHSNMMDRPLKQSELSDAGEISQQDLSQDLMDASECLMEALMVPNLTTVAELNRIRSWPSTSRRLRIPPAGKQQDHAVVEVKLHYKVQYDEPGRPFRGYMCSYCCQFFKDGRPMMGNNDQGWHACLGCVDKQLVRERHQEEATITSAAAVPSISSLANVQCQSGCRIYKILWDAYSGEGVGLIHRELPLHRAVAQPNCSFEIVRHLVEAFPMACRITTSDKQCPLHIACRVGCSSLPIIEYLFEQCPEVLTFASKQRKWLPLHFAIHYAANIDDDDHGVALVQLLVRLNPKTVGPNPNKPCVLNWGARVRQASPDVLEFTKSKARKLLQEEKESSSGIGGGTNNTFASVLGFIREKYHEQEAITLTPARARRMVEIRDRLQQLHQNNPRIARLAESQSEDANSKVLVEVAGRVSDKLDCLFHYMITNVDRLAVLCSPPIVVQQK